MTDRELLEQCIEAFEAVPVAARSRIVLKKIFLADAPAYAGNRSHVLALAMAHRIREHLELQD